MDIPPAPGLPSTGLQCSLGFLDAASHDVPLRTVRDDQSDKGTTAHIGTSTRTSVQLWTSPVYFIVLMSLFSSLLAHVGLSNECFSFVFFPQGGKSYVFCTFFLGQKGLMECLNGEHTGLNDI